MVAAEKFETMDRYIESFPENVRSVLEKLRATVQEAAPEAVESISYDMPTFKLNGERLVYFSAWKNHIGLYSIPEGNEAFRKELSPYAGEKGSLRFPLDKPIPYDLVKKIVMLRTKEIRQKKKRPDSTR
jgi:uncharacterized protein YdhG (YjbR/CyaY superfamily)